MMSVISLYGRKLPETKTRRVWSWRPLRHGWIIRRRNRHWQVIEKIGRWTYLAKPYNPSKWI